MVPVTRETEAEGQNEYLCMHRRRSTARDQKEMHHEPQIHLSRHRRSTRRLGHDQRRRNGRDVCPGSSATHFEAKTEDQALRLCEAASADHDPKTSGAPAPGCAGSSTKRPARRETASTAESRAAALVRPLDGAANHLHPARVGHSHHTAERAKACDLHRFTLLTIDVPRHSIIAVARPIQRNHVTPRSARAIPRGHAPHQ